MRRGRRRVDRAGGSALLNLNSVEQKSISRGVETTAWIRRSPVSLALCLSVSLLGEDTTMAESSELAGRVTPDER